MDFYPLFLKLQGKRCTVIGGGKVAFRKAISLHKAGAILTVIAPSLTSEFSEFVLSSNLTHINRRFRPTDVEGNIIVIAATDEAVLNKKISVLSDNLNILCNVPDDLDACRYIVPAIVDRSPLMIAISSGGHAPVLTRLVRQKLEILLPSSLKLLATFAKKLRKNVKQQIPSFSNRRYFWEQIFEGPIASKVLNNQIAMATRDFHRALTVHSKDPKHAQGEVYLVGAGPGDPELLTLKALRILQQADIVYYDNLVSDEVLNLARRDAERIYVGKRKNAHAVSQSEINQHLIQSARRGNRVCRLKGGDSLIFGRGGEELEALAEAGINFQIVPGITAASGCTTYAGIPLTHRDYADTVIFVSGHQKNNGDLDINFSNLVFKRQTLVFYMGLSHLAQICLNLQLHGLNKNTPAAAIEQGTSENQRIQTGTIENLAERVRSKQLKSPTLIVIGEVVTLSNKLHWFGEPPNNDGSPNNCDQSTPKSIFLTKEIPA